MPLEREPCLELDDPPRQSIRRPAELAGVNDVRRCRRRRQRFQIQDVQGVEEVGAKLEFGPLAQQPHPGKIEILAEGQVQRSIARSRKDIAAAAARPPCRRVEFRRKIIRRIRKDAVLPLLFAGIGNHSALVQKGQVGTITVSVAIRTGVAAADQRAEWKSRMLVENSPERPPARDSAQEVMAPAEKWQLPISRYLHMVARVKIGTGFV